MKGNFTKNNATRSSTQNSGKASNKFYAAEMIRFVFSFMACTQDVMNKQNKLDHNILIFQGFPANI